MVSASLPSPVSQGIDYVNLGIPAITWGTVPLVLRSGFASRALLSNVAELGLFHVPFRMEATLISVRIHAAGGVGSRQIIGIYDQLGNQLLLESFDSSAIATVSATISLSLPQGVYIVATCYNGVGAAPSGGYWLTGAFDLVNQNIPAGGVPYEGTLAIAVGTLPTFINLALVTPTANCVPIARFDQ